jgi:GT2 family glycosyltransferase
MAAAPSLSLVIPVHNGAATLGACLDSVVRSGFAGQVLVVDDGSGDDSVTIAERYPFALIRLTCNVGASEARNVGARAATGEILFFLDCDIKMQPDTIQRIRALFGGEPTLTALFGSYQKNTEPKNFASVYKNLLHHYTHQISSPDAATFCSGYGAIRREVFLELGGFDPAQRALEDIEFGYRLHRAGYRVRLVKDLQFTHLKTYSLASLVRSDVRDRAIPWTRLMLERNIFRNDLNTKTNNVVSVVIAFLILLWPLWGWFVPLAYLWLAALLLLFVGLNLDFLVFCTRERGLRFGLQTLIMTWFNYVYSGVGLALGVLQFARDKVQRKHI